MSPNDATADHRTRDELLRIEEVCDRFEDEWRAGRRPDPAAFAEGNGPERVALLRELIRLDVEYRRRAGETPTPRDYADRFPEVGDWDQTLSSTDRGAVRVDRVQFGDYELLGEIARGGMGVVYKARQVSLNRPVAVKMILAGELAGPDDVRRFHAEAKRAANLNHPNVLPIYEVGERYGQPFFSMKLVGSSLNRQMRTFADQPERIAKLVATLARAVECAHQTELIHRDLKPANVLIDADGTPYVADFGLAKLAGAEDGQTKSGAIVGTPSYMPPEQARGEKVSPATDVYALGAILYELITGKPPFQGPTALDTILEVLEREPVHPRALNPAADRDLSLIALKCLEKDPGRRYPTAAALAADLESWLAGEEPITAGRRPVPQRLLAWARREPGLACRLLVLGFCAAIVQINDQFTPATKRDVLLWIMVILAGWAVISIACQSFLRRDRFSTTVVAVWVATDVALLTCVLILDESHETPLALGYGVIVAMSGVWLRVGLVWFATAAAVVGYAVVITELSMRGGTIRAVHHHVIAEIALVAIGGVVAYQVRRARLLSRFRGTASSRPI
jgi:eukaryotic-like serine/threonine-protein kinase